MEGSWLVRIRKDIKGLLQGWYWKEDQRKKTMRKGDAEVHGGGGLALAATCGAARILRQACDCVGIRDMIANVSLS